MRRYLVTFEIEVESLNELGAAHAARAAIEDGEATIFYVHEGEAPNTILAAVDTGTNCVRPLTPADDPRDPFLFADDDPAAT